jgi:hypothetical protein
MHLPEADALNYEEKVEGKWQAIPRISRVIPFGYKEDPEDRNVLLPIQFELDALELAKKYVRSGEYSLRAVSEWLSTETGRSITHVGLSKRIENERRRKYRAKAYSNWANKIEEARRKANALRKTLGSKADY